MFPICFHRIHIHKISIVVLCYIQLTEATLIGEIGPIVLLRAMEEYRAALERAPILHHNMEEKIVQALDHQKRLKNAIQRVVQVDLFL